MPTSSRQPTSFARTTAASSPSGVSLALSGNFDVRKQREAPSAVRAQDERDEAGEQLTDDRAAIG